MSPLFMRRLVPHCNPVSAAVWLVLAVSLLHLLVIARFDLSVDEAHYALYGLYPDWSYFDHPPLVGWLQALVLKAGSGEWLLRLWPLLLATGSAWLLYHLTRCLYHDASPWLPFIAVALLQSAILFQVLSLGLVPELPLLFCGLGAALALWRALHGEGARFWLLAGLCLGLAGLAKYTAITLVLSALLVVGWEGRWGVLRSPWPWLAVLLGVLLVSPVFYWNAGHDWLSFRYQLDHGVADGRWQLVNFLRSQAAQLIAYGPLLFIGSVIALVGGLRHRDDEADRFLLAFALPILLIFGWSGGFDETLPHWTLLGWAFAAPLAARLLLARWSLRATRWLVWGGAGYAVVLTLVVHSELFRPWLPFEEHRHPLADLHGWSEVAQRAAALYDQLPATQSEQAIYVGNRWLAGRLAWYARPRPVQVLDRRTDQFDLWFGEPQPGAGGILVVPHTLQKSADKGGVSRFADCQQRDFYQHTVNGVTVHSFWIYECLGLSG
ncbi:MAG: glycosyltransferase family 39 protein [Gammaproteobacteria bacterium]|nr:glycosyltransferase family 39 protein [Gammaproteobacteria bacterium]